MSNLKLITTERFGELDCNFYRNMNDDVLLTREQIGTALEYANPSTAIKNIHRKHKDRLEPLSMRIKLGGCQNEPTSKSEKQECVYYTQRGVMEICRWSRQPKANEFMDWTWMIVEKYRNGEIYNNSLNIQPLLDAMTTFTQSMDAIQQGLNTLMQDVNAMKKSQKKKTLPEKKYSRWKTNTFAKLNTLLSYVNEHSDENLMLSEIIHLVIGELEDTYSIELGDYVSMYKSEFELDINPYALDVINHYKDIRDMFTLTLNSILEKLHIVESNNIKTENIFDVLAEKLNED